MGIVTCYSYHMASLGNTVLDSRRNFPHRDEPGEEGESTLGAPEQLEGGLSPQDHLRFMCSLVFKHGAEESRSDGGSGPSAHPPLSVAS